MLRCCRIVAGLLLLFCVNTTFAHELQPASLELRQLTPDRFEVIWRAPIYYQKPHPARLELPETWQTVGTPTVKQLPDSALHRRVVDVPRSAIDGAVIRFAGLEATITDVFARFKWLDGSETTAIARPSQPWVEVVSQRSAWQVAWDYTLLGIDHILSGFDHLTFVLALLLIVSGARRLLVTVTSFTLAHSITLAAATLGVLWVPGAPIEATIALSILFLAVELVKQQQGKNDLAMRAPWIVAFIFGLLHGFGFAGALTEIGLPQSDIPLALLMFNVGVEIGQLLFIAAVLVTIGAWKRLINMELSWLPRTTAYGIGAVSVYWVLSRVALF